MEIRKKRILLSMAYFTLSAFAIIMSVIFMIFLATTTNVLYAQIGYYILSGALVLLIVYDIICTYRSDMKYISGIIIYCISVAVILMSIVLFFTFSTDGVIPYTNLFEYGSYIFLSYIASALAVAAYTVGERLIQASVRKK